MAMNSPWIIRHETKTTPRMKMIALHFAGGSAVSFQPWLKSLPSDIELLAVQLPGRWERFKEPFVQEIQTAAEEVFNALQDDLAQPVFLVGYSLGALIGFEVARMIEKKTPAVLKHFLVLSRNAPDFPTHGPKLHQLSDDEFINGMQNRYGGMQMQLFNDPELKEMFLTINREDMRIFETYNFVKSTPLQTPLTAWRGKTDPSITLEGIKKWHEHTAGVFEYREFEGGHFFPEGNKAEFFRSLLSLME